MLMTGSNAMATAWQFFDFWPQGDLVALEEARARNKGRRAEEAEKRKVMSPKLVRKPRAPKPVFEPKIPPELAKYLLPKAPPPPPPDDDGIDVDSMIDKILS